MSEIIHHTIKAGVLHITLNRKEYGNALNSELMRALSESVSHIPEHVRCVLIEGAGKHFCLGADLAWMQQSVTLSKSENIQGVSELATLFKQLYNIEVPVIAWVQGGVYGGGLGILGCADLVYAHPQSTFCFSETKLGLIPAVISPYVVPKIGLQQALSLYLTAESFDAHTAKRIGLIHEVLESREAFEKSFENYLKNAPLAQKRVKQFLRMHFKTDISTIIPHSIETLAELRCGEEAQEGLAAFLEKRTPAWKI